MGAGAVEALPQLGQNFAAAVIGAPQLLQRIPVTEGEVEAPGDSPKLQGQVRMQ